MNKKLLLALGTSATIIAPVITVVSCSKDYSYSAADKKILSELDKTSTRQKFEDDWMSMVFKDKYGSVDLNTFSKNNKLFKKDFISSIKYTITENIRKNPSFLIGILSKIVQNDNGIRPTNISGPISAASIAAHTLGWDTAINTIKKLNSYIAALTTTNKKMEYPNVANIFFDVEKGGDRVVFNPASLNIKNQILKLMVAKLYLKITKKQYKAVFASDYLNNPKGVKELTTDTTEYYPLLKETTKSKLAFEWKFDLDAAKSAQFVTPGGAKMKYAKINSTFIKKINDSLKFSESESTIPVGLSNVAETSKGYKGIVSISGSIGNLSPLAAHMKKQTKQRFGWLFDSQVVTKLNEAGSPNDKEITVIKNNKLSLTKVQMIMPISDGASGKETLKFENSGITGITYETAINALLSNNPGIYDEAVKYYTTKKNPIQLQILNKKIRDILLEKGFEFIKKD